MHDVIIDILSSFIDIPANHVENEIHASLKRMGEYVQADRAYIFALNFQKQTSSNTHEWCAPDVAPEIDNLQDIPWTMSQDWIETIMRGDAVHVPDVLALPPCGTRDILYPQGILTCLALPLMKEGLCVGFVGFDWVQGHHDCTDIEFKILRVFAQLLSNVMTRIEAEQERDAYRERLSQQAKLDAMGRMADGFAHDFGNVLTVIQGYTRQALRHLSAEKPVEHDLRSIEEAAERAATLTHRLMAIARKQKVEPVSIDLNSEIEKNRDILQALLGPGIKLLWKPGSDLGLVRMDPGQLSQLLTNLCANARDAMPAGGTVEIESAAWTESGPLYSDTLDRRPGRYVRLTVRDTGRGMEPHVVDRIFEPFFTTKTADKGTGLGLAIVFGIVKQNHCFLEVTSTPGTGTAIRIFLPL